MPLDTDPALSEDDIDDLLYLARTNELLDLQASLQALTTPHLSTSSIISAAIDPNSGNGILHMAAANGHTGTFLHCYLPLESKVYLQN